MVGKIFSAFGLQTRGMHEAAYLLAAFALLSQLLALVRDRLLAGAFGADATLDIYYAAFRIPDLLFALVASLLSLYALLPVLTKLEQEHPDFVLSFMRRTLLVFFCAMGVVSLVVWFFVPQLAAYVAPGIVAGAGRDELVALARILLLQPILLGASNIFANLTQLRSRFLLYSISPLLYNLGIIAGIVCLYPAMGLAGLGWGVVIGAALHALVQVPFFTHERPRETVPFARFRALFMQVLKLSVPRTFTLAMGQVTLVVLTALASLFTAGSIAVFMFAWNLQAVPLAIIGVSYSVAAFPTLSRFFAGGEHELFVSHVGAALRHILFWAIPATVFVIVLRAYIVRAILGTGAFDWTDTRLTAAALALFVISLSAQAIVLLIARAYYAAGQTFRPFVWALAQLAVSVCSAWGLLELFAHHAVARDFLESLLRVDGLEGTTVLTLSLAFALGSMVQGSVALVAFHRDFGLPLSALRRLSMQSFSAAVIGGACAYGILEVIGPAVATTTLGGVLEKGVLAGAVGLATAAGVLRLLKNQEWFETYDALKRRFRDRSAAVIEPTEIAS